MVLGVIILAVLVIVCMVFALMLNSKSEIRFAIVSMSAGLVFLICMLTMVFSQSFGLYVKKNVLSETAYLTEHESLPLPENSFRESIGTDADNVFITKATAKEIESFYEGIAEEDSFVLFKTEGLHKVSLKYKGKTFSVRIGGYKEDYRMIVISTSE